MSDRWADEPYPTPRAPASAAPDTLAVAALLLSLLPLPVIGSALAIVFGYKARTAAWRAGRHAPRMATAGMLLGYGGLAVAVVAVIITVTVITLSGTPQPEIAHKAAAAMPVVLQVAGVALKGAGEFLIWLAHLAGHLIPHGQ